MPLVGETQLQPVNFLENYARGLEIGTARRKLQEEQVARIQAAEQEKVLNELYERATGPTGQINTNQLVRGMAQQGFGTRIPGALAAQAEVEQKTAQTRKAQADAAKIERENKIEGARQLYDILGVAEDDDSWQQVYNQAQQAGLDLTNVPQKWNPVWVKNAQRRALGYAKFLENERESEKVDIQRGELNLSRQRLAFERNKDNWMRANPEYDLKETALGYVAVNKRNPSDTRMVMVDGKPATGAVSQKATEDQLKTAYNADRMLSAGEVIGRALEENPSAERPGFWETTVENTPFIRGAVNFTRDDQRQQIAAAQVQLADALLYLATGAAYNELQYTNNQNAVIPAFSDSDAAIRAKRKLFLDQVAAAKRRAAAAWTPEHEEIYKGMLKMYDTPLAPPPGATKELLADPSPEAQREFDEAFGAGAAAKVLKAKK